MDIVGLGLGQRDLQTSVEQYAGYTDAGWTAASFFITRLTWTAYYTDDVDMDSLVFLHHKPPGTVCWLHRCCPDSCVFVQHKPDFDSILLR